jgi:hypothetical protein
LILRLFLGIDDDLYGVTSDWTPISAFVAARGHADDKDDSRCGCEKGSFVHKRDT